MARRRETGVRSGLAAEVTEHLERQAVRADHFAASSDGWFADMAVRRRDATRAKLDRLAAGAPVTVEGCMVGRPSAGACRLTADGDVSAV